MILGGWYGLGWVNSRRVLRRGDVMKRERERERIRFEAGGRLERGSRKGEEQEDEYFFFLGGGVKGVGDK